MKIIAMQRLRPILGVLFCWPFLLAAQARLGINTTSPVRTIDVYGTEDQFIRVHSTSNTGTAGFELVRGSAAANSVDWRFLNTSGQLRIEHTQDNFTGSVSELLRVNSLNRTGIGTNTPNSLLHVDGGTQLAFGGDGYLNVGSANSFRLAFDNQQLQAFGPGGPSALHIQPHGGNTYIGNTGGNIYMAMGNGTAGIGTYSISAKLNVERNDGFQVYIQNPGNGTNGWRIGATNDSWSSGDNQLVFSPTSSSSDAVLRLHEQDENDGLYAPVMIEQSTNHAILLDGNEIDTRGTSLYFNYNTESDTYLNPTGGRVGIGTSNPQARLHVKSTNQETISLENGNSQWFVFPAEGGSEDLYFGSNGLPLAHIDGGTGEWYHMSDRRRKENLEPLEAVTDKLLQLGTYRYRMKADTTGGLHIGILAQEALPLFPEMVFEQDGQYGVDYGQLAAVAVKALQEQQGQIESLREKIRQIKERRQADASTPSPETQTHRP